MWDEVLARAVGGDICRMRRCARPLLAVRWIDAGKGMPPMRFAELVAGTVDDRALLS